MADISKDPEVWLMEFSELLQTTRTLWHSSLDPASDDCRQLREHVQALELSACIFEKYEFQVILEYKQKAGQILVSSGSLAILSDLAERLFELIGRKRQNAEELKISIDFLEDILCCLVHITDHNAVVCKAVQDHQRLVPTFLIGLEECHREPLAGTLQEKMEVIIKAVLIIVHNMASFEENVQYLRGLPNVLRVLQSYTTGTTERNRFAALTTIAELLADDFDMLATDTQMVRYILEQLEQARSRDNGYSDDCWEVTELIRAIAILAKNEDNKKLLVQEAVLSYMERVLTCTNYVTKDCTRCHETIKAILNLSTVEQHKDEITKSKGLLNSVVKIYRDKARTHSKECFNTAEKVLSSLLEKLQAHQKYKRIAFQIVHGQTHEAYKMSARPRGHCLIVNNRDFSSDFLGTRPLKTRHGTDVDRDKLTKLFEGMQFKVTCQNNASDSEMKQLLQATAHMDHSRYDVFVCCVLSHGDTGYVYGSNGVPVEMRDLMAPFQADSSQADSCRSLAGKPKLFFIQACQGSDGERGHDTTETDVMVEDTRPGAIPNEADFLLGYCTVPGYVSYRHVREGSWYISTLCDVLDIHYENRDILDILTMVNKEVSEKMGVEMQQQVPAPMYTLKKKLIFGE